MATPSPAPEPSKPPVVITPPKPVPASKPPKPDYDPRTEIAIYNSNTNEWRVVPKQQGGGSFGPGTADERAKFFGFPVAGEGEQLPAKQEQQLRESIARVEKTKQELYAPKKPNNDYYIPEMGMASQISIQKKDTLKRFGDAGYEDVLRKQSVAKYISPTQVEAIEKVRADISYNKIPSVAKEQASQSGISTMIPQREPKPWETMTFTGSAFATEKPRSVIEPAPPKHSPMFMGGKGIIDAERYKASKLARGSIKERFEAGQIYLEQDISKIKTPIVREAAQFGAGAVIGAGKVVLSPIKSTSLPISAFLTPVKTVRAVQADITSRGAPIVAGEMFGASVTIGKLSKVGTKIAKDPWGSAEIAVDLLSGPFSGKRATLRGSKRRITKAEMRKQSYSQAYDPRIIRTKEEFGVRIPGSATKDPYLLERRVTVERQGTGKIVDISRDPLTSKKQRLQTVYDNNLQMSSIANQFQNYKVQQRSQRFSDILKGQREVKDFMAGKPKGALESAFLMIQREQGKSQNWPMVKREPVYRMEPVKPYTGPSTMVTMRKFDRIRQTEYPSIIQEEVYNRPGFRPGMYEKIQARIDLLRKQRAELLPQPIINKPYTLLKQRGIDTSLPQVIDTPPMEIMAQRKIVSPDYLIKGRQTETVKPTYELPKQILRSESLQALASVSLFGLDKRVKSKASEMYTQRFIPAQQQDRMQKMKQEQVYKQQQQTLQKGDLSITTKNLLPSIRLPILQTTVRTSDTTIPEPRIIPKTPIPVRPTFDRPIRKKPLVTLNFERAKKIRDTDIVMEDQAYNAYVKNPMRKTGKGKYRAAGFSKVNKKPLPKTEAQGLVMATLDRFSNRSGFIRQIEGSAMPDASLRNTKERLAGKFRQAKRDRNILVEKSGYAIDSFEEKMDIPYKAARLKRLKVW